ncbi:hypothetical protein [Streptomyces sp. NPDC093094]|uniref:hypothetical protein n=1 Tax=Streptomyces sp. NPDC093094 TaxID=3366026 RepID=UPI0037FFDFA9
MRKSLAQASTLACLLAAALAGAGEAAAAPAEVQAQACRPGATSVTWQNTGKSLVLTHGSVRTHIGTPEPATVRPQRITTVKAVVSGGLKPAKAIDSLGARTRLNLVDAGKATPATVVVRAVARSGRTVFFAGTTKASGSYRAKTCNAGGTGYGSPVTGKATSWTSVQRGAVNCADRVPSNSLARKAQARFCG